MRAASPSVQVNVRIEPRLWASVQTQARREDTTYTALVEAALRAYLTPTKETPK